MGYDYNYLIVGGGMTADSAVAGIRENDPTGTIGLISMEGSPPYQRPPLSKKLWSGKPLDTIWLSQAKQHAKLHLGRRAVSIDRESKILTDDLGYRYSYERLLLAVGGSPRRFAFEDPGIVYFRTLRDYWTLRFAAMGRRHIAVIGGGFIGAELAAALTGAGCRVTLVFPEPRIGSRVFPPDLGDFLNDYYRSKGVDVRPGRSVQGVTKDGEAFHLTLVRTGGSRRERIVADLVVAGIGLQPNLELAEQAGLSVEDGIIVDETLRTNDPSIFAAGDVARYPSAVLGRSVRVEHEDNSLTMGKMAGAAMAGKGVRYTHQPYFYSDLFDLGYEAVGDLDPGLPVVADWEARFRKGVLYYLREGRVVGVLLWNVWDKVPTARKMIAEGLELDAKKVSGAILRA